jgi:protein SCO1/2
MLLDNFVKRARFASLALLACACGVLGAAVPAAATGLVPVHGVVLSQPDPRNLVVRLDAVPGSLSVTTREFHLALKGLMQGSVAGREIDALYDASTQSLSDVTPAERYTAGVPDPRNVYQLAVGQLMPNVTFVDQTGQRISINQFRGKTIVLSFIYTRCPDRTICPAISGRFAYLQTRIDPSRVVLLEITVDPQHDSPSILASYASQYGADPTIWHIMTGEQHSIADALTLFGLANLETHPGDFVHDDVLAFIDSTGHVTQEITTEGWSPDDVLATIAHINGQSGNWFARMRLESIAKLVAACGGSTTAAVAIMDSFIFVLGVVIFGSILAWFARRIWE